MEKYKICLWNISRTQQVNEAMKRRLLCLCDEKNTRSPNDITKLPLQRNLFNVLGVYGKWSF